jgi:leucyl/phenylalanyl-tRNA---protein transferase
MRTAVNTLIPPELLLRAYSAGFFPMADSNTGEIGWHCWDVRGIFDLEAFHIPSRLQRELRKRPFEIRIDTAFNAVITGCADREDTWISDVIRESYRQLFDLGFAHSVEAWRDGALCGGLYGVAIRGAFFGESMFHVAPNASKAALIALVNRLRARRFRLLDTQMVTSLTEQFGAHYIPFTEYQSRLAYAMKYDCVF